MKTPPPALDLGELLSAAGWDLQRDPISGALEREMRTVCALFGIEARASHVAALKLLRAREHARNQCRRAVETVDKMEGLVQRLVEGDGVMCRFERLAADREEVHHAWCRYQGQLCELPVHPEVPIETLANLQPWQYVRVNPRERVIVGTCEDGELLAQSLGEVVEFRGFHDAEQGLAFISRDGHELEVVRLAPSLRDQELRAPTRLILQRDDPRQAIAVLPAEQAHGRFEIPVETISARLDDLAGLEQVIEPFFTAVLLPFLHPEVFGSFGVTPLRGAILYSFLPGQGKTALMRGLAGNLHDLGQECGFDLVLYHVKPNELKIVWHGGDAKLVREELCGAIRARQEAPRTRPLFQLVVLDEIDSLGKRAGGDDGLGLHSPAQNDAVQALLVEMDGMLRPTGSGPPAHVLWVGLTNRPDMLDEALKRPGRFGDLVREIPALTFERAESILALYACRQARPWFVDGEIRNDLGEEEVRARFLRPALADVYSATVLRCTVEGRRDEEVAAGQVMAGAHYEAALNAACRRAAERSWRDTGVAAIGLSDLVEALVEQACGAAAQMEADRRMLARQLRLQGRVSRVEVVPADELGGQRYLRERTA